MIIENSSYQICISYQEISMALNKKHIHYYYHGFCCCHVIVVVIVVYFIGYGAAVDSSKA